MPFDLRLEEGALHLRMETHTPQQQTGDGREAQHTGVGKGIATEEDLGPQQGHIHREETHALDHPYPERVGTLDLPCLEQERQFLVRESHLHTADRGRPLNERGYLHRQGRGTRDVISLLPGTHDPGSQTRKTTNKLNAPPLQYDVLSMPHASPPQSLLVDLRLTFIQKD